jgi:predicted small lipoprotein YifL
MKSITCMFVALLLFGVLAGCGQSGPLYVPGDPSSIQVTPEIPASDEEKDEDSDNGEKADSH